ncbi:glycosyltransferase [Flavobacterium columnare]|uniref:Glycosyltransferase n=1 Tax=Flavobacterium columnare TaxID=996 RepID=A0A437UE14_9FLAO|nr:glycosyltransferase [Flavobacterium columnare]RVU91835.1 glycosyltransferase [Flavobacterium columnare]
MRIVQLIDSLEVGGAEKMAVSYANALSRSILFSGIITSRKEGLLRKKINEKVDYFFLERKSVLDIKALLKFYKYLKKNKINYIQAHGSSFFLALCVKMFLPNIKIIWHDHYGFRYKNTFFQNLPLILCSFFLDRIIVVNKLLLNWSLKNLFCKNVKYLPNFIDFSSENDFQLKLKGKEGKKIICLANLRPQKNHFMLIEVAKMIREEFADWTFHLVGKDFNDDYSKLLKEKIIDYKLEGNVFLYGSISNTFSVLKESQIGILTSISEGFPVALLEYGYHSLGVVVTDVGEIPFIINSNNGFCVKSNDHQSFFVALKSLIKDENLRREKGMILKEKINNEFDERKIISDFISFIYNGNTVD